jgi:hypothetical protein
MGVTAAVATTAMAVNSLSGGAISNAISGGGSTGSSSTNPANAATYDPYAPYRSSAASTLANVYNNPSLALSDPGFTQSLQTGMQTTNRGMAATGQLQSGQEQVALSNLGMNTFSSYYNNKIANLMQMSGASQSPAAAGQAQSQAAMANAAMTNARTAQFSSGLGAISGLANSYNGSGWGNTTTASTPNYSYMNSFGGSGDTLPGTTYSFT